ncbi:ATP-binding protein [Carboxydochorda subterranea]|uniref:Oxygen sensor histidine kinase NreB n=1 Tax=Carboxydichorda subterranea TaxID=3109565 RepID=A0ABZ1BVP1_9FIRM|nr:ATP-binding protein [Limnochorda sp. L945t]WRP16854.1 ATP-binding protein [Limnochorda sp. L945t]
MGLRKTPGSPGGGNEGRLRWQAGTPGVASYRALASSLTDASRRPVLLLRILTITISTCLVGALLSLVLLGYVHRRELLRVNLRSAETVARLVEASLEHAMLRNDRAMAARIVESLVSEGNLEKVRVLDTGGAVRLSSVPDEVGTILDKTDAGCRECHGTPGPPGAGSVLVPTGQRHDRVVSVKPILNAPACRSCHDPGAPVLGVLMVESSVEGLLAQVGAGLPPLAAAAGISVLLLGGLLVFALDGMVTRPVRRLALAARTIGAGDLEHEVPLAGDDEVGLLARELEFMRRRLKTLLEEREGESRRVAALQERDRLARELHDRLAQVLSCVKLDLAVLEGHLAAGRRDEARAELWEMKELVQSAHLGLRETIFNLRLSATPSRGLVAAVRECLDACRTRYGVEVDLVERGGVVPPLPPEVEAELLRAIQEALSNAGRHAAARLVRVVFEIPSEGGLRITVEDDGRGFDPARTAGNSGHGFGLRIMRERLEGIGGRLEVHSRPREGTRIVMLVPGAGKG